MSLLKSGEQRCIKAQQTNESEDHAIRHRKEVNVYLFWNFSKVMINKFSILSLATRLLNSRIGQLFSFVVFSFVGRTSATKFRGAR